MTSALAPVPVPGTDRPLMAAQLDGTPMVAFRPLCEALGVDADSQLQKIKSRTWATTAVSTVVAADGKNRQMVMVDRRTMTMWLATLNENRVSAESRPVVIAYQSEAADALDSYFHAGVAVQPSAGSQFDMLRSMVDHLEAAQRTADEAKSIASDTSARLDAIEGRHDWYAAVGYARANGITNTSTQFLQKVGTQAAMIARRNGIEPVKVQHALYGSCNSLPAWVWELAFADRQSVAS